MKKMTSLAAAWMAGLLMFAFTNAALAEDKEVTIKGEGKCAKCSLKESATCQNVIVVTGKNGKKTNYFLVQNDIAKDFHSNVCKESKNVKAMGTVKKTDDGKMEFTAKKIEIVKDEKGKDKEKE